MSQEQNPLPTREYSSAEKARIYQLILNPDWKPGLQPQNPAWKRVLRSIRGRIRLFFGFCPECNSDAPEIRGCDVCQGYSSARGKPFPPSLETKAEWKARFEP